MILEVGFVVSVYFGFRLSEYYQQKTAKKNSDINLPHPHRTNLSAICEDYQGFARDKSRKKTDHYLKVTIAHLGLAAIRQFIYPSIALLYLGFFIYISFPLYRRAEQSLIKEQKVGSDVSLMVGNLVALATGQYLAIGIGSCCYFLGDKIIVMIQMRSQEWLTNSFAQLPRMVWCLRNYVEVKVPLEEVNLNDVIVVTAGEIVPIDGVIMVGTATIDPYSLTGESQPVTKTSGDQVVAAMLVIRGKIWVKTAKTGKETTTAQINHILTYSAQFKTQTQLQGEAWADKMAVPFLGLFLLTASISGPLTGLVILTAHLGTRIRVLAPLDTFVQLNLASQNNIFIKDTGALEGFSKIDTLLINETSTLITHEFKVSNIILCDHERENELLTYAAVAQGQMTHPLAKALLNYAKTNQLTLPSLATAHYQVVGHDVTVNLNNQTIQVGSADFMSMTGITLPNKITAAMAHSHTQGHSLIMVAVNRKLIGAIEIQAVVPHEVKQLISQLRQHDIQYIAIISEQDNQLTKPLAETLGIDNYCSALLPQDQAAIVEQLQKEGKTVCLVGNGVNDAIAMRKANVAISLTGVSATSIDVAQIVLIDGKLNHILELKNIYKNLMINLRTSLGISFLPSAIILGGALGFNLGFTSAIIIKNMIFLVGIGNAMLPLSKASKLTTDHF